MHPSERYVTYSLELHLFFARIMKEHSLFLMAGFTPANPSFTKQAEQFKNEFEALLAQTATVSDGIIGQKVLASGELFTPFTLIAEQQTQRLTGIEIHQAITIKEQNLCPGTRALHNANLVHQAQRLNRSALQLLDGLICLKEKILCEVLNCRMFTMNYPLLLEHILREAKLYRAYVCRLETDGDMDPQQMGQIERFWNQIMMEHALFIRGLLDPSENELVNTADGFAQDYARLLAQSRMAQDRTLTESALAQTTKFRDFKLAGVKGIESCEIRSVILPLLADHVLREANHYLRLLEE